MRSAKVERFEDLIVWQKAEDFAVDIYRLTNRKSFCRDFKFLLIARGSVAEGPSQLHIARSLKYLTRLYFENKHFLCQSISDFIGALRKSLQRGGES